ncbi:hypothetical protein FSP39_017506 [Pinctada imbricata]|uniref:Uncharacterized protein n=1 Tax=Pinctada imbricata TaxID=66713 RepID=A0AA88Y5K4_PINIB|nr:hypothetical protein FSP39_017506 [Pinctada imbricata]
MTYERVSVALLVPANVMYSMAFVTHSWFELPGASYGLWLAEFCDYLRCQLIPAFFTEEPVWYHILQILSLLGLIGMTVPLILLTSKTVDFGIPEKLKMKRHQAASTICIASGFVISLSLLMFYGKLDESHTKATPQIRWSSVFAGVACLLQLGAGLVLTQI